MAGFQSIPVEEIVQCARENMKATRRVRLSKEDKDGREEPDHAVRQRAMEFITEQTAGAAGTRKAIDPPLPPCEEKPGPGLLIKRRAAPADTETIRPAV